MRESAPKQEKEMTKNRLLPGADEVVRRMLPVVLESRGLSSSANALRRLPRLRDLGSVTFAVLAMSRAAKGAGPAASAVRLCSEAALAAVRGDAGRFASLVRDAAEALRQVMPGSGESN